MSFPTRGHVTRAGWRAGDTTAVCCRSRLLSFVAVAILSAAPSHAGPIEIADLFGSMRWDGGVSTSINTSSPGFFSSLDGNSLGEFGWTFVNSSGAALTNLAAFAFLDADIDRHVNTAFNEYGEFVSLAIPPGAPAGATGPTSWEIDEPGFLFGDITSNIAAGRLDAMNGVPGSIPDDVSLALAFDIPLLLPGDMVRFTLLLSDHAIGGLRQFDPDSGIGFSYNGHAEVVSAPAVSEPGTMTLTIVSAAAAGARRWQRRRRASRSR